jgi:hypothetical protein
MAGRRATSIGIDCDEAPGASGCVDRSDSEGRCEGDGGGDGGGGGNGGGGPGRGRGGEGGGGGESVITREGVRLKLPKSSGRGVVVATAAATVVVIVAVIVGGGGELPTCGARSRLGTGDGAEDGDGASARAAGTKHSLHALQAPGPTPTVDAQPLATPSVWILNGQARWHVGGGGDGGRHGLQPEHAPPPSLHPAETPISPMRARHHVAHPRAAAATIQQGHARTQRRWACIACCSATQWASAMRKTRAAASGAATLTGAAHPATPGLLLL